MKDEEIKSVRDLEGIIVKDKTLISCDNDKCELSGDLWRCYLNNHVNCGIYQEWQRAGNYIK